MSIEMSQQIWAYGVFAVLLFVAAAYCILVSKNLIRILIGLELFTKAVTLLLVAAAFASGRTGLGQSVIITLIVVEVVVIAVAAGIVIGQYKHTQSISAKELQDLKG
ncbi:MAG: hypothetical protein A3K03_08780 [Bdellovibrionales bacterium RIFOXYD1_FULL_44_7]|nr:MAG: hypothetical protein A3K03_08780 [Bdellovibrionales bacterium RIFOXYD1_FULL_44_7]